MLHSLATWHLPEWWTHWNRGVRIKFQIQATNSHDAFLAVANGAADVLICFHNAHQSIHLDPEQYDRQVISIEDFKPYVSARLIELVDQFPGAPGAPVPLLMYPRGTFLGRIVEIIIESIPYPIFGETVFQSEMADVLRNMALKGHGIAWLPEAATRATPELVPLSDARLSIRLSVVAYRDRRNDNHQLRTFWSRITNRTIIR